MLLNFLDSKNIEINNDTTFIIIYPAITCNACQQTALMIMKNSYKKTLLISKNNIKNIYNLGNNIVQIIDENEKMQNLNYHTGTVTLLILKNKHTVSAMEITTQTKDMIEVLLCKK
jgi:hypothetical protein